jgi:ankyrin repeat protein
MTDDGALRELVNAIASADDAAVLSLLAASPGLARAAVGQGATRAEAADHYLSDIHHYVYSGDTALHIAAAARRPGIVRQLISLGADVSARNRRGAQPLHYAADGQPGLPDWDPELQAQTIACLIAAGAQPDATDQSGVAPLHRAIRTRSALAVQALLTGGADIRRTNKSGSTPMKLATQTTGRGGSGSPEAKAQQAQIIGMLERHGATA